MPAAVALTWCCGGDEVAGCRFALITVFFVGTMSILTILVQGATMPWLLYALRITKKTPVQACPATATYPHRTSRGLSEYL